MINLHNEIKKELLMKMKFMDTTIKGIEESAEYKEAKAYNTGIRDAINILDMYKDYLSIQSKKTKKIKFKNGD